jgi:hypothetical protein
LAEQRPFSWIQTARQEIEGHTACILPEQFRVTQAGKRVVIGDKVERFAFVLQGNGRAHHAEVVADVQDAAGLYARQNAHSRYLSRQAHNLSCRGKKYDHRFNSAPWESFVVVELA